LKKKNRGRDPPLRGNYIGKIPIFSVLGAVNPTTDTTKAKFGREENNTTIYMAP